MIELFVTTECESVESPIRQIRPRDIAVVLLGDMAVFLAFVVLGRSEHGIIEGRAFVRTALPFAVAWLVISPWLGAYRASTLYNAKTAVWRVPLIWVLCGVVGLLARALLTDRPLTLAFALVAIAVQGASLVGLRGLFTIVAGRLSRP